MESSILGTSTPAVVKDAAYYENELNASRNPAYTGSKRLQHALEVLKNPDPQWQFEGNFNLSRLVSDPAAKERYALEALKYSRNLHQDFEGNCQAAHVVRDPETAYQHYLKAWEAAESPESTEGMYHVSWLMRYPPKIPGFPLKRTQTPGKYARDAVEEYKTAKFSPDILQDVLEKICADDLTTYVKAVSHMGNAPGLGQAGLRYLLNNSAHLRKALGVELTTNDIGAAAYHPVALDDIVQIRNTFRDDAKIQIALHSRFLKNRDYIAGVLENRDLSSANGQRLKQYLDNADPRWSFSNLTVQEANTLAQVASQFSHVTDVDVRDSQLTDAQGQRDLLKAFVAQPHLKTLTLDNCGLKQFPEIDGMKKDFEIHLPNNPISFGEQDRLKKEHGAEKVFFSSEQDTMNLFFTEMDESWVKESGISDEVQQNRSTALQQARSLPKKLDLSGEFGGLHPEFLNVAANSTLEEFTLQNSDLGETLDISPHRELSDQQNVAGSSHAATEPSHAMPQQERLADSSKELAEENVTTCCFSFGWLSPRKASRSHAAPGTISHEHEQTQEAAPKSSLLAQGNSTNISR